MFFMFDLEKFGRTGKKKKKEDENFFLKIVFEGRSAADKQSDAYLYLLGETPIAKVQNDINDSRTKGSISRIQNFWIFEIV